MPPTFFFLIRNRRSRNYPRKLKVGIKMQKRLMKSMSPPAGREGGPVVNRGEAIKEDTTLFRTEILVLFLRLIRAERRRRDGSFIARGRRTHKYVTCLENQQRRPADTVKEDGKKVSGEGRSR